MFTKTELRKEMKERRKTCSGSPESVFLSHLPTGQTFFVYRSFASEAKTDKLISILIQMGKHVVTPRVVGKTMVAVEGGNLVRNLYGIEESDGEVYEGKIDVAIIPLLATDVQGHRLGYGGGFYDRFLENHPCYKVGLCYEKQILSEIPFEPHDILLNAICTEQRFFNVNAGE